jgi:hypothetical protein
MQAEREPMFAAVAAKAPAKAAAPAKQAPAKAVPPKTTTTVGGLELPLTVGALELLGAGVRVKFAVVKVYSLGVYGDVKALVKALKGKTGAALLPAAIAADVPKEFRLVLARAVTGKELGDAFSEQLAPKARSGRVELRNPPRTRRPRARAPRQRRAAPRQRCPAAPAARALRGGGQPGQPRQCLV